jgi:hypothetical protein
MKDDRILERDGRLVRLSYDEVDAMVQVAFTAAAYKAMTQLGVSDDDPGKTVDSINAESGFGNDFITVRVRLTDGREATASASIWNDSARAN